MSANKAIHTRLTPPPESTSRDASFRNANLQLRGRAICFPYCMACLEAHKKSHTYGNDEVDVSLRTGTTAAGALSSVPFSSGWPAFATPVLLILGLSRLVLFSLVCLPPCLLALLDPLPFSLLRRCGELARKRGHLRRDLRPRPLPLLELLDDGSPQGLEAGRTLVHPHLPAERRKRLAVHLRVCVRARATCRRRIWKRQQRSTVRTKEGKQFNWWTESNAITRLCER